ncbi:hypothetical protein T492DRAFT_942306 [Pavlovales sp. CCMP2436]|nr:hypothetical protein T492DRAFT_942306 [Pavlovales sp. CCMP2436]|mmetsp:Transcript_32990/g.82026  ORF Transcript_32990/g.82026 Transcript_32990/m.82026 type:complete len:192 (-) Transcript_32990:294-869(-)
MLAGRRLLSSNFGGRRLISSDVAVVRGRLVEQRTASRAGPPVKCATGTFSLEAIEIPIGDATARSEYFSRAKLGALEHLQAQLDRSKPGSTEHITATEELEKLRKRTMPLGVLLCRPDVGEIQPGDMVKVRILEMEFNSRFIKCSRVYPRKMTLRVVLDPSAEDVPSVAARAGREVHFVNNIGETSSLPTL